MSPVAIWLELEALSRRLKASAAGKAVDGGVLKKILASRVSKMRRRRPPDLATEKTPRVAERPSASVKETMPDEFVKNRSNVLGY